MQIVNLQHPRLNIRDFQAHPGEFWCIYGSADSGIDEFLKLLDNTLTHVNADIVELPHNPSIISFDTQQSIYEDELRNDDSDFMDKPDPGTLAHEFLPAESLDSPLIEAFNMRSCLSTGYRQLSSGQSRKILLLKALLSPCNTVIIDSPYEGLDPVACKELDHAFSQLPQDKLTLLVLIRNKEDIPEWCSHLAIFHNGQLKAQGPIQNTLPEINSLSGNGKLLFDGETFAANQDIVSESHEPEELIRLQNGFASYGEKLVFSGLDLLVSHGDHTLITGQNGCGKSTLLHMITGDNPKCYANELYIRGRKRGSGESIWDIKQQMGIVSPEIHRSYRVPGSALHVVLSGLFDTIGLYQRPTPSQEKAAMGWLKAINMQDQAKTPFRQLPYGKQRLVIIARALIKQPPLLVLDEPTQGLDDRSRHALLDFLELVATKNSSTILYVSHRQNEYRPFFKQHIKLEKYS
ncbi:ATP-binding cassette domain-containing protein [Desulfosediminicola flagellatus]|uniref:ATP-binding cassette domain-containing protein n=1 Tax=Desulfosediminicola flagellatus TaxID=2569541 RepID=UPI0010ABF555|nr:ATP-binding cassette domain-containing protein [Desulfosediminicola flagellatus]